MRLKINNTRFRTLQLSHSLFHQLLGKDTISKRKLESSVPTVVIDNTQAEPSVPTLLIDSIQSTVHMEYNWAINTSILLIDPPDTHVYIRMRSSLVRPNIIYLEWFILLSLRDCIVPLFSEPCDLLHDTYDLRSRTIKFNTGGFILSNIRIVLLIRE